MAIKKKILAHGCELMLNDFHFLVSVVDVTEFQTVEAYSCFGLTEVK